MISNSKPFVTFQSSVNIEIENQNKTYCPHWNTKYAVYQILEKYTENEEEKEIVDLVEIQFSKISWKSQKSVMVVAKSLAEHNNSFMILGSQTKEIAFMFNELLSKTENNYHIETKKNVDTTYSRKMLLLSNKLHNKFNIIKNFFQIENNTFETSDVYFNLKSAIIYTIDLMSMSLQSNSHISVKFDPCLPIEVKGDKSKFEQILSTFMELTVEMTESGEISLSTSLQSCIITEGTYLIAFDIEFEPTNPHSRTITSQMLFDSTCVQREILKADLKKREETFMSYINKFKGIPHLQIGLIRDVIYRMITLIKGTYKIKHKAEKVIFNFTLPLGRGHTIMKEKEVDPLEISISPFTSLDNGKHKKINFRQHKILQ